MRSGESNPDVAFLLARHETEPEHTRRVAALALDLFDGLDRLHGLGPPERSILEGAALLHDVGWSRTQPDGKGHHKATAEMIRSHGWTSLTPSDIRLMAAVARYHRRSLPAAGQPEWDDLPPARRPAMEWMAACLRIADGLDRRHLQRVERVQVEPQRDGIVIRVDPGRGVAAELEAAGKKADLLARISGLPVRFPDIQEDER